MLKWLSPTFMVLQVLDSVPAGLSARDVIQRTNSILVALVGQLCLSRLDDEGYVTSTLQPASAEYEWEKYRLYQITQKGKDFLREKST